MTVQVSAFTPITPSTLGQSAHYALARDLEQDLGSDRRAVEAARESLESSSETVRFAEQLAASQTTAQATQSAPEPIEFSEQLIDVEA